jgi:hypothetical protein
MLTVLLLALKDFHFSEGNPMRVCVRYYPGSGRFRVSVYGSGSLLREWLVESVRIEERWVPPVKDFCVEADVVEHDATSSIVAVEDVKGRVEFKPLVS